MQLQNQRMAVRLTDVESTLHLTEYISAARKAHSRYLFRNPPFEIHAENPAVIDDWQDVHIYPCQQRFKFSAEFLHRTMKLMVRIATLWVPAQLVSPYGAYVNRKADESVGKSSEHHLCKEASKLDD